MENDPQKHHRRSIRLKEYDYSQSGAYFVTICTYKREQLFGEIKNGIMCLNENGRIVYEKWFATNKIRNEIKLYENEFIIMPNHIHGIVWIITVGATGRSPLQNNETTQPRGPKNKSLSSFIAGFKSAATKHINKYHNTPGKPLWQRNYYEHIIRNEPKLNKIQEYIINNPINWELDELYNLTEEEIRIMEGRK
jgi:REP element-mobilizing transposase RayT